MGHKKALAFASAWDADVTSIARLSISLPVPVANLQCTWHVRNDSSMTHPALPLRRQPNIPAEVRRACHCG
jgi:hypothetical protein